MAQPGRTHTRGSTAEHGCKQTPTNSSILLPQNHRRRHQPYRSGAEPAQSQDGLSRQTKNNQHNPHGSCNQPNTRSTLPHTPSLMFAPITPPSSLDAYNQDEDTKMLCHRAGSTLLETSTAPLWSARNAEPPEEVQSPTTFEAVARRCPNVHPSNGNKTRTNNASTSLNAIDSRNKSTNPTTTTSNSPHPPHVCSRSPDMAEMATPYVRFQPLHMTETCSASRPKRPLCALRYLLLTNPIARLPYTLFPLLRVPLRGYILNLDNPLSHFQKKFKYSTLTPDCPDRLGLPDRLRMKPSTTRNLLDSSSTTQEYVMSSLLLQHGQNNLETPSPLLRNLKHISIPVNRPGIEQSHPVSKCHSSDKPLDEKQVEMRKQHRRPQQHQPRQPRTSP